MHFCNLNEWCALANIVHWVIHARWFGLVLYGGTTLHLDEFILVWPHITHKFRLAFCPGYAWRVEARVQRAIGLPKALAEISGADQFLVAREFLFRVILADLLPRLRYRSHAMKLSGSGHTLVSRVTTIVSSLYRALVYVNSDKTFPFYSSLINSHDLVVWIFYALLGNNLWMLWDLNCLLFFKIGFSIVRAEISSLLCVFPPTYTTKPFLCSSVEV